MDDTQPQEPLSDEEKLRRGKEILVLLLTIGVLDGIAVVLALYLSLVLGWGEVAAIVPLVVIMVIATFYFQWKIQKIKK